MYLGGVGHVEIIDKFFGLTNCPLMCEDYDLIVWLTDIIGFSGERWCFLGWGMVAFSFCINMVPINE